MVEFSDTENPDLIVTCCACVNFKDIHLEGFTNRLALAAKKRLPNFT